MANEVACYIESDLERLLTETRPEADGTGGLAVPLGLTCFAITDYFGFLTREGSGVNKIQTEKNISHFIEHWLPQSRLGCSPALLRRIFRNGMTHQFFAKASGITRGNRQGMIVTTDRDLPELNADALADTVLGALKTIDQSVAAPEGDTLALRMNQRLDQLAEEDQQELELLLTIH